MAWNAVVVEADATVPEGKYGAMPVDIRDMDGIHGPMIRIDFILSTDDEWDGRRVSGLASKKLSENTKLGQWVAAILGRMPNIGEEVFAEDFLNKDCRVLVNHKSYPDGKVFVNVVRLMPVGGRQDS